jgi:hypothetical protein
MRIVSTLPLLVALPVLGCASSLQAQASPPAFEMATPTGVASVSIRKAPPGMTDAEFAKIVARGMASAMSVSLGETPAIAPYPTQRIVWQVNPMAGRGITRLFVNVSDGPDAFAYEQQVLDNDAPPVVLRSAVTSMTNQLLAEVDRHDARASAYANNIASGPSDIKLPLAAE